MGSATLAPVCRGPSVRGWSKPTNTPTTRSGENPMNQVSNDSFEVPVFPASGRFRLAMRIAVPRSTTPLSIQAV